jgi:hypothetical protein
MYTESLGWIGRSLRRSLRYPFGEAVGAKTLLIGGTAVMIATLVQGVLMSALLDGVPVGIDVEYTNSQFVYIYRVYVLTSLAFLLLMAPVYGYLLGMLQRLLSPNSPPTSGGLASLTRKGLKLSLLGTLFTFLPQSLTQSAFGSWTMDLSVVIGAVVTPEVATVVIVLLNTLVIAYVFPAVLTRLARRDRLTDLLVLGWYRATLTERRYVELGLAVVLVHSVVFVVNQLFSAINQLLYPSITVFSGGLGGPGSFILFFLSGLFTFYVLVVQFHLIGSGWDRIRRAQAYHRKKAAKDGSAVIRSEYDRLYDPTAQQRLNEFVSTSRRQPPDSTDTAPERDVTHFESGPGVDATSESAVSGGHSLRTPVHVGPAMSMDRSAPPKLIGISESLTYPWTGRRKVGRLIVGGLLVLLSVFVIPAFAVFGYLIEVLHRTMHGSAEPPAFEDWNQLFVNGLRGTVICLVYAAVFSLVSYLLLVTGAVLLLGGYDLTGLGALVVTVLVLSFTYVVPAALAAFAEERTLGSAFAFDALRVRVTAWSYAASWLVAVVLSWLALALMGLLFMTGLGGLLVPFIGFYAIVAVVRLVGHGCSNPSGVETVPSDVSSGRGAV